MASNEDIILRLSAVLGEVHDLLMQLDPDEDADPENQSPEDMTQHVTGLAIRLVREAQEIIGNA